MNARLILLQALLPLLSRMAESPNKALAAEAAEEHAVISREMAKIKRSLIPTQPEAQAATAAKAA